MKRRNRIESCYFSHDSIVRISPFILIYLLAFGDDTSDELSGGFEGAIAPSKLNGKNGGIKCQNLHCLLLNVAPDSNRHEIAPPPRTELLISPG